MSNANIHHCTECGDVYTLSKEQSSTKKCQACIKGVRDWRTTFDYVSESGYTHRIYKGKEGTWAVQYGQAIDKYSTLGEALTAHAFALGHDMKCLGLLDD